MNVLPLIHRELLVNARKPATRRLRVAIAVVTLAIAAAFLLAMENSPVAQLGFSGKTLFQILIWLAFATAGLFGVFFAADTISEERREGTLGLLFLTPLTGCDVVIGKLAGCWLRTAYGLLAALPVIGLALLLGGVTFANYFEVALVLGNTLFVSTAVGLMISSISRDSVQAMMGTLLALVAIGGLPLWIDVAFSTVAGGFQPYLSHASPVFALYQGANGGSADLWFSLALQHGVGWLAIVVAAWRTSRVAESSSSVIKVKTRRNVQAAPRQAKTQARDSEVELRNREPITWLVKRRSRGPTILAAIAMIMAVLGTIILFILNTGSQPSLSMFIPVTTIIYALLYFVTLIWLAVQSTRHTSHARQQGELELLLATPISVRRIVTGYWHGLIRIFGPSVLVIVGLAFLAMIQQAIQMQTMLANSNQPNSNVFVVQTAIHWCFGSIGIFTTTSAVAWVGLWLGLTSEKQAVAAAKAFALVVVVPALFHTLIQMFGVFTNFLFRGGGTNLLWLSTAVDGSIPLAIDVGFIFWARRNLLAHFREAAGSTFKRRSISLQRRWVRAAPGS
ncbi:ABC transporter permease subunit [bacterium]|nr:ABC transporter permease subunit [bacterium]